jgi:DNA-binding beta-propeller fold protein YncE
VHRYRIGTGPRLVTAAAGRLWVSDYTSGRLSVLDIRAGQIRRSGPVCAGPQGVLVRGRTVWVACTLDNLLVGVDRRTLAQTEQLPLPGSPDALTGGAHGQLLVALQKGPRLAVVDPSGPAVVRTVGLGHLDQLYDQANIDVAVADGFAWVSSYLQGGVYRLRP